MHWIWLKFKFLATPPWQPPHHLARCSSNRLENKQANHELRRLPTPNPSRITLDSRLVFWSVKYRSQWDRPFHINDPESLHRPFRNPLKTSFAKYPCEKRNMLSDAWKFDSQEPKRFGGMCRKRHCLNTSVSMLACCSSSSQGTTATDVVVWWTSQCGMPRGRRS